MRYKIDRCEPQTQAVREGKIEFHALTKGSYPGMLIPKNVLPGLNSVGFWDACRMQDWGLNQHRNEGIEIMFLETGSMVFTVDQNKYSLRAGHFTITRPWQLHKLGGPNIGPGRLHWLILDVQVRRQGQKWQWPEWMALTEEDLSELTQKLRRIGNPVWASTPAIAQSFRELACTVMDWQRPHAVSRLVVNLNQLFVGILDALLEQQTSENEVLTSNRRKAEFFFGDLEQNRIDVSELWTRELLAKYCGMGITTLSKYCRRITNAGPMEFLNSCRLECAAKKLREDRHLSVTEIALACGFNSSQYFAKLFNRRFHFSPTKYREKMASGNASK